MADSLQPAKYKLEEELEVLGPALLARLKEAKDSLEEGDLEALSLMVETLGTCSFQVKQNRFDNEWSSPLPLGSCDKQSSLLYTFLALLWQTGKLRQVSYDPIELQICSQQKVQADNLNSKDENSICWENNSENSADDEEAFNEEGINYLIGPYDIDLDRKDYYHSLFASYRKSYGSRTRNFLNSKHLPKARKLSGNEVFRYDLPLYKEFLDKAAASVEELDFTLGGIEELEMFRNVHLPKLRRLSLWLRRVDEETGKPPLVFLPPMDDSTGLRYLRAHLPKPALMSLLQNNAKTLLELHLKVGTAHSQWDKWPHSCRDLHELLLYCSGTLRRLVLIRDMYAHNRASCLEQVKAIRQNLPGLKVVCEFCCSK